MFVEALRASFSNRVSREQAVTEWQNLKHNSSIDQYLDTLIRLMWRTGYKGAIVEDKLKRGLNARLAKDWARVVNKPETVERQIALVREMGHSMEDYDRTTNHDHNDSKMDHRRKEGKTGKTHHKDPEKTGDKRAQKAKERAKRKYGKEPTEWKERNVELKGIPDDILKERRKSENCEKCGKKNHKWVDCWTKEPVITRVTHDTSKRQKPDTKKDIKIAALTTRNDRLVELDSEGEYELLRE